MTLENTKKTLVSMPVKLMDQLDYVATVEHRNRSDLIREASRMYIDAFKRRQASHRTVSKLPHDGPHLDMPHAEETKVLTDKDVYKFIGD